MSEKAPYPFHQRIILLSLVFLLANVGSMAVIAFRDKEAATVVAPHLEITQGKPGESLSVRIWDPYQNAFVDAQNNQTIFMGTEIQTGKDATAMIVLNQNIVRLGANTQLAYTDNHFSESEEPLLTFRLKTGEAWVNAYDPIRLEMNRAAVLWHHSAGDTRVQDAKNQLAVFKGVADLNLLDTEGKVIKEVPIPLNNTLRFAEGQITDAYRSLEYSKLKKELGIVVLQPKDPLNPWFLLNKREDRDWTTGNRNNLLGKGIAQTLSDRVAQAVDWLAFAPKKKEQFVFQKLDQLFREAIASGDTEIRKGILSDLEAMIHAASGNPVLRLWIVDKFYRVQELAFNDPSAEEMKDVLRRALIIQDPDRFSPTYLFDLNEWLSRGNSKKGVQAFQAWAADWKKNAGRRSSASLEQEARILHSVLLAHIDEVTTPLLDDAEEIEALRMELSKNNVEILLNLAGERIETSAYLINVYRYREAKRYLRKGYATLKLDSQGAASAARELFTEESRLILQRIQYAQDILDGAPQAINETDFQRYRRTEAKNQELMQALQTSISTPANAASSDQEDARTEAIYQLSSVGIGASESTLTPGTGNTTIFTFLEAPFVPPSSDNTPLFVSGEYDLKNDTISKVTVGGASMKGEYVRKELAQILEKKTKAGDTAKKEVTPVPLFPADSIRESENRTQAINRDLIILYVMRDLNKNDIGIANQNQLTPLSADLTKLHVKGAALTKTHPRTGKKMTLDFDYDVTQKTLSNIQITSEDVTLFESYPADQAESKIVEQLTNPSPAVPE
ncbi:hypothetical protein HZA43_04880 [Candidatus Peregrinibacteria bacterium]|nr:hypothetical protein [Candidatus Peregrinibacteria bacterium]